MEKLLTARRWLTRAWLAGAVLFVVYNLYLLTDHHRIRVNLVNVRETPDPGFLAHPPDQLGTALRLEAPSALTDLHVPGVPPLQSTAPPSERALEIFRGMVALFAGTGADKRCWNAESPQLIADNLLTTKCRGFCADYAILLAAMAQQAGIPARRVVMEGSDGLGGSAHVVTELWLEDLGQWVMMDLSYFAMLQDRNGNYLSTVEARRMLLGGERDQVKVQRFFMGGNELPDSDDLLDYYTQRINDLQYPTRSNFLTEHKLSWFRRAISSAEQFMARWGPVSMSLPRFAGRLIVTSSRFRVVDQLNPESYAPRWWFLGYRVWLGILALGLLLLLALNLLDGKVTAASHGPGQ